MVEIKWTEKASGDLEAIHKYIARDSKVYASRFIKSLISATIKLETMPFSGRIVPELEIYGFREIVYYNYRIVYRIIEPDSNIEILAVTHGAHEIKKALNSKYNG
jgi:addiction module RelE/StbE family toxin